MHRDQETAARRVDNMLGPCRPSTYEAGRRRTTAPLPVPVYVHTALPLAARLARNRLLEMPTKTPSGCRQLVRGQAGVFERLPG